MNDDKQYDWVLLTLLNPEFTTDLFNNSGINTTNTSIYDRDRYANSPLILGMEQFQTDGKFDKVKFNNYYDGAITGYNNLSSRSYAETAMEQAQFSYNNLAAPREKRTKPVGWDIVLISNPDRRNYSTERMGFISDPKFTPQELALNEQIWNDKTQRWEDSPNDSWLFRNWSEPVAMATWDFDADANGNPTKDPSSVVYHKGEYKINPETGTYYYEKLNGKSPYGKELLTPFDIITKDGSKANEYDFFDSDSLNKSFTGSLMKNVARIAPMFIPYVGPFYVGANIALELGKVLPIVYKSTFGLAGGDLSLANRIEGFAMSMDNNKVSYAGRENFFNSENILNMIGDVAKLLYEQRWIFSKAPRVFKKYSIEGETGNTELDKAVRLKANEYIEKGLAPEALVNYTHLGKDTETIMAEAFAKASIWGLKYLKEYQDLGKILSRLYMTGTSSYQAFSDAKEMGASDTEAAAMFWGYAAGMYWLMGTEVGEHVLPELRLEKLQIKKMLTDVARTTQPEIKKGLDALADSETARRQEMNVFKRLFTRAAEAGKDAAKKGLRPTTEGFNSIWSNMLAEGIEEVSEEVLYDVTRSTFDILAKFSGSDTRLSQWNTALERYGQSFLGGMIGGGLFLGINDINIRKRYDPGNVAANQELIYMIRNGQKTELKRALTELYNKNMLGNPGLSTQMSDVENGQIVYKEGTADDNQNLAVYKLMNQYIDFIDEVLSTENMMMPDDAIISDDSINGREVLQEIRYRSLMANPVTSQMLQDYNSMAERFLDLHDKIDTLNAASDEEKRRDPQWQEKMDTYNRQLQELRDKRDKFFDLENQERYRGIMMFSSNQGFADAFANVTYRAFVNENYHKDIDDLTDFERELSTLDYEEYLLYYASKQIGKAYDFFMLGLENFSTTLQNLGEQGYKQYAEVRNAFLNTSIQVPDANGQMKNINFMLFVADLYGVDVKSDEDFLKLAEDLKTRYNPFDEIAAYVIKKGSNPVGANLQSTLAMFQTLSDNLRSIVGQFGFVDEYTAKTIDKISKDATSYDFAINESLSRTLESELDPSDPNYNVLADAIMHLGLGFNINNIQQKLAEFTQEVNNTSADDYVKLQLINVATTELNARYTPELIAAYNGIQQQIANVAKSPIAKFLEGIKVSKGGLNIFELLNKAQSVFQSKDISEFVIDGELDIEDIRNARNVLRQLRTFVRAMMFLNVGARVPYGFTSQMNVIRLKLGKDLLGILETADASLMLHDIAQLDTKLRFVERLHNMNHETSLKELSRVQVRLHYEAFKMLGNTEAPIYKDKEFDGESIIDSNLAAAINDANTVRLLIDDQGEPLDLSELDSLAVESEIIKIENAFYDRIVELCHKYGTERVLSKLFENVIDSKLLDTNSPGITSRTQQISETDKLGYLMSVLSVKTSDFLYKYSPIIEASDLAPIPILEMSIRLGYGLYRNPDLFNLVLDILDVPGGSKLRNTIFISGVPGAGKTNAIAKILYLMIAKDNPNVETITCGPGDLQVNNLTASLNPAHNTALNKEQLFLKLGLNINDVNNPDNAKIENGKLVLGNDVTYSDDNVPDVIFIDEATHFTNLELQRIAEYCNLKLIKLFLLGDSDLTGKRNFVEVTDENGLRLLVNNAFQTVICVCSPKSTVSMRDSNSNKRDNNELTKALATEWNLTTLMQDAQTNGKSADEYLLDLIDKGLVLKGTEHSSGIYGELLVDSVSEEQVVKLIENLQDGEKVGYVYSDTNSPTYALMDRLSLDSRYAGQIEIKSVLEFFDEGSVQGSENLFFIVDIDWDEKAALINAGGMEPQDYVEYLNFVKSVYTTTTRSKQGSYILDRGFSAIFGDLVGKVIGIDGVSKVSMNDLSLVNYKQKRLDRIRGNIQGHTPNGQEYPNVTGASGTSGTSGTTGLTGTAGSSGATLSVSSTKPAKLPTPINKVTASNFDTSTVNFTDDVVGVYILPASTITSVELNGYVTIKLTSPQWFTIATELELKSLISGLQDSDVLYVITFPKALTSETEVGTIAPKGSYIGNQHIFAAITNDTTVPPLTPPTPPSGGQPNGALPINLDKFKVGYIKTYNGQLYKIKAVDSVEFTVEDIHGVESKINILEFVANASNGTKKAWDSAVQAANQPVQPTTKFNVGDLLAINNDDGTEKADSIFKVVNIAFSGNSWKYIIKNLKTNKTLTYNVETIDGNDVKFTKVQEAKRKLQKPQSVTITPEAMVNIIHHAQEGPGIMLYTAFGIREGLTFKRDDQGLVTNGTNYIVERTGEIGNPLGAMLDMLALFGFLNGQRNIPIKISDYNEARNTLYKIQSAIKFGKLDGRNPIHKQVLVLINKFRKNLPDITLLKGRFLIKLLPEQDNGTVFDYGANYFPDSPRKEAKLNKCLVYTVEDTNGLLYEFYVGTIATGATVDEYVDAIKKELEGLVSSGQLSLQDANVVLDAWTSTSGTVNTINNIVKKNGSRSPISYISLPDTFTPSLQVITNTKLVGMSIFGQKAMYKDEKHPALLENFRNNSSRIVSKPRILTGLYLAKMGIDPSMAGQAVVFVTHDLLLKYRANASAQPRDITNPDLLGDLWNIIAKTDIDRVTDLSYKLYLEDVKLKIKVVKLDSVGYTFLDLILSLFAFRNSLDNRSTNQNGIILPIDNSNTGARMLELLLNLEADILEYIKNGSSTAIDVGNGKFKGLPKFDTIELLKGFERDLRWLLIRTIKMTTEWDGYTQAVRQNKLKLYLDQRDAAVKQTYGLGNNDDFFTNIPTDLDILKIRLAYGKIINLAGMNNPTLSWVNGGTLLVTGKPISTKVMLAMSLHFSERMSGLTEWKLAEGKRHFLTKLSNVIQYYNNDKGMARNNFRYGIFYTPIYNPGERGSERTATEASYPAVDIQGVYTVDVDAQSPDIIINGNAYQTIVLALGNPYPVRRQQSQPLSQPLLLDWTEWAKQTMLHIINTYFGGDTLLDLMAGVNISYANLNEAKQRIVEGVSKEIEARIGLFNAGNLSEDKIIGLAPNSDGEPAAYTIPLLLGNEFVSIQGHGDATDVFTEFKLIPTPGSEMLHGEVVANGKKYSFISDGFTGHQFTEISPTLNPAQPWDTSELRLLATDMRQYMLLKVDEGNVMYSSLLDTLVRALDNYAILSDLEIQSFINSALFIATGDEEFKNRFEKLIKDKQDCTSKIAAMFNILGMM